MLFTISFLLWSITMFIIGRWYQQRRIERRVQAAYQDGRMPPSRVARLFIIRHMRWFVASVQFWTWWNFVGCHLGVFPNDHDTDYLQKIWEGEK